MNPNHHPVQPTLVRAPSELGIQFSFDTCTRFFNSIVIKGWAWHLSGKRPNLKSAAVQHANAIAVTCNSAPDENQPHATRFHIQILMKSAEFPKNGKFLFEFNGLGVTWLNWDSIRAHAGGSQLSEKFRKLLEAEQAKTMLDIGGRARSGVLRAEQFPGMVVDVLDIHAADGVTVVCDAHKMSEVLPYDSYDAVMSVSVFEHLVMPWKVAIEINRILKPGGIGMIMTHQTVGMHDMPWDFLRFSDTSWLGIFNRHTGFEILETELASMNYIIPFFWSDRYEDAEKAAGYEISSVLIRKISSTSVDWPLSASDVTENIYPPGEIERLSNIIPV